MTDQAKSPSQPQPERLFTQYKDRAGNVFICPLVYFSSEPGDEKVSDMEKLRISFYLSTRLGLDALSEPLVSRQDEQGRWPLRFIRATLKSPGDKEGEYSGMELWVVAGPQFDEVIRSVPEGADNVRVSAIGKFHSTDIRPDDSKN